MYVALCNIMQPRQANIDIKQCCKDDGTRSNITLYDNGR